MDSKDRDINSNNKIRVESTYLQKKLATELLSEFVEFKHEPPAYSKAVYKKDPDKLKPQSSKGLQTIVVFLIAFILVLAVLYLLALMFFPPVDNDLSSGDSNPQAVSQLE